MKITLRLLYIVSVLFILYSCKRESNAGGQINFNIVGVGNSSSLGKLSGLSSGIQDEYVSRQDLMVDNENILSITVKEDNQSDKPLFKAGVETPLASGTVLYYGVYNSGNFVTSGSITYQPNATYPPIMLTAGTFKIVFVGSIGNVLPAINFNQPLSQVKLQNLPITSDLLYFEQDVTIVGLNTTQNINVLMNHQLTKVRVSLDTDGIYTTNLVFGDLLVGKSYDSYDFQLANPRITSSGAFRALTSLKANADVSNPNKIIYKSDVIIAGTDSIELTFQNITINSGSGNQTKSITAKVGDLQAGKSYIIDLTLLKAIEADDVTYAPGNLMYRDGKYYFANGQDELGDLWAWQNSGGGAAANQFAPVMAGGVIGPYVSNPCSKVSGYGSGWVMMGDGNYINVVTTGSLTNGNVAFKTNGNNPIFNGPSQADRAYFDPNGVNSLRVYGFYIGTTSQPTDATKNQFAFFPAGSGSLVIPPYITTITSNGIYWVNHYAAASGTWNTGLLYFENYLNPTNSNIPFTRFLRGDTNQYGRIRCIKP